jgi:large-conductance mechanosensitive channel
MMWTKIKIQWGVELTEANENTLKYNHFVVRYITFILIFVKALTICVSNFSQKKSKIRNPENELIIK